MFKLFLRSLAFKWNKEFQSRKKTQLLLLLRLLLSLKRNSINISQRLLMSFLSASILTPSQSTSNSEPRSSRPSPWSQAQLVRKSSFFNQTKLFNLWSSFKSNRWMRMTHKDLIFSPPGRESALSWRKNSLHTWTRSSHLFWPRSDSRLRWRLKDRMELTILRMFLRRSEPAPKENPTKKLNVMTDEIEEKDSAIQMLIVFIE